VDNNITNQTNSSGNEVHVKGSKTYVEGSQNKRRMPSELKTSVLDKITSYKSDRIQPKPSAKIQPKDHVLSLYVMYKTLTYVS
jgi:hypothetical protein